MLLSWCGISSSTTSRPTKPNWCETSSKSRQAHPDAGARRVVARDQAAVANYGALHCPLEAEIPPVPARRARYLSPRPKGEVADSGSARSDSVRHAQETQRPVPPIGVAACWRLRWESARTRCIGSGKKLACLIAWSLTWPATIPSVARKATDNRQNRARGHRPRHLHLDPRPGSQAPPLDQRLFGPRSSDSVEILRPSRRLGTNESIATVH
jgi:hypothetical protein